MNKLHIASGLTPLGMRVLVHVPEISEKTSGGIILPDDHRNREGYAQVEAEILSIGEMAFLDMHVSPKVGDRVSITRHGGYNYKGKDGNDYRILRDDEVVAIHRVYDPQTLKEKSHE